MLLFLSFFLFYYYYYYFVVCLLFMMFFVIIHFCVGVPSFSSSFIFHHLSSELRIFDLPIMSHTLTSTKRVHQIQKIDFFDKISLMAFALCVCLIVYIYCHIYCVFIHILHHIYTVVVQVVCFEQVVR